MLPEKLTHFVLRSITALAGGIIRLNDRTIPNMTETTRFHLRVPYEIYQTYAITFDNID